MHSADIVNILFLHKRFVDSLREGSGWNWFSSVAGGLSIGCFYSKNKFERLLHLIGFIIGISVSLTHNLSKDYSTGLADTSQNNFPRLLCLLCGPSPPQWTIITSFAFVMRCVLASEARESYHGDRPSNANVWWVVRA